MSFGIAEVLICGFGFMLLAVVGLSVIGVAVYLGRRQRQKDE